MKIVHQFHLWLVYRNILVKPKVGSLKRNLIVNLFIFDSYKCFSKCVEFKKYLHGVCDVGSRLLFRFRSAMHGLNKELCRHSGR